MYSIMAAHVSARYCVRPQEYNIKLTDSKFLQKKYIDEWKKKQSKKGKKSQNNFYARNDRLAALLLSKID